MSRTTTTGRLVLAIAPALALLSPVVEAFGALSVPFFTRPSLVLCGGIAAAGLALGLSAVRLSPGPQVRPLRDAAFVLVLVVVALAVGDVVLGGHAWLGAVAASRVVRLSVLLLAVIVLGGAIWPIRRYAGSLLSVMAVAFFATSVARNLSIFRSAAPVAADSRALTAANGGPPFIYIVVDEAMGIAGLDLAPAPGGASMANRLRALFDRHAFRLYDRAFSRHYVSGRSIPDTLNFDFDDDSWGPKLRHADDGKVGSPLFDRLSQQGMEVVSYDTPHIDFCFPVASRCEILPSFNPFSPYITNSRFRASALFQIVQHAFAESYVMYTYTRYLRSGYESSLPPAFSAFDAYAFPTWFNRFEGDVLSSPRGRAYFAHLLMPHSPYVLDESCRETGHAVVPYFLVEQRHLTGAALDREREDAFGAYERQYGCLVAKLDDLLTRIDQSPVFKDATIVIQGDHGSRISSGQYVEYMTARDMVDNYSALYALRTPGVAPGLDARETSVQRLTAEYFSGRNATELGPDNLTVTIDSVEEGKVVERPMPDFDHAALAPPAARP